ncbi:MAG TPA: dTDP-4-dehydrorhamnose 3,5-epimerase family protein [Gaiellaceae bacterium]|nr:dTDP-4-dehydrorhamnose 3,5-epimerase family protein [Gaiellaceae bacterium]
MRFAELGLPGAYLVELERREDERGWFARLWDPDELGAEGLDPRMAQISVAWNERRGTLRGLHYQADPHGEAKLVRCTRGAIYDVLVDLRPGSPAYTRWVAIELRDDDPRMLYVPMGVAHGYQTLADGTETLYLISEFYRSELQRGVRWDDPAFAISWPDADRRVISERDAAWPDFTG